MAFLGFGKAAQPDAANTARVAYQTEKALAILIGIGTAGLAFLGLWAALLAGLHVFVWSLVAAFSALVAGGALGLLFGLPTTQTGTVGGDGRQPEQELGYRESTSLEQVADWLTKILIGLTLTQYDSWEAKFTTLSVRLTEAMLGGPQLSGECAALLARAPARAAEIAATPACSISGGTPIPGGVLIALYSILGFLVSYLWMRRYFMHELVAGKEEARAQLNQSLKAIKAAGAVQAEEARVQAELNAKRLELSAAAQGRAVVEKLLEDARAKGLAPMVTDPQAPKVFTIDELRATLQNGRQLLPADSKGLKALTVVGEGLPLPPPDPEDPWRGKFGKSQDNGLALEASFVPTPDPAVFTIELVVRAIGSERAHEVVGMKMLYYLHPTYGVEPRLSTFGADARAPLNFYARDAFTVGAIAEDGTRLELNLATLDGAPDTLRMR